MITIAKFLQHIDGMDGRGEAHLTITHTAAQWHQLAADMRDLELRQVAGYSVETVQALAAERDRLAADLQAARVALLHEGIERDRLAADVRRLETDRAKFEDALNRILSSEPSWVKCKFIATEALGQPDGEKEAGGYLEAMDNIGKIIGDEGVERLQAVYEEERRLDALESHWTTVGPKLLEEMKSQLEHRQCPKRFNGPHKDCSCGFCRASRLVSVVEAMRDVL